MTTMCQPHCIFLYFLPFAIECLPGCQATDIDCYEDLHAFPIKDPDTIFDWRDDDTFARLRLQGEYDGGVEVDLPSCSTYL